MSNLKNKLEAYEDVKQFMLKKGFLSTCDCGRVFYANPQRCDNNMIYGAVENAFCAIYSDKTIYRDSVKKLLDEGSIVSECENCGKKFK